MQTTSLDQASCSPQTTGPGGASVPGMIFDCGARNRHGYWNWAMFEEERSTPCKVRRAGESWRTPATTLKGNSKNPVGFDLNSSIFPINPRSATTSPKNPNLSQRHSPALVPPCLRHLPPPTQMTSVPPTRSRIRPNMHTATPPSSSTGVAVTAKSLPRSFSTPSSLTKQRWRRGCRAGNGCSRPLASCTAPCSTSTCRRGSRRTR